MMWWRCYLWKLRYLRKSWAALLLWVSEIPPAESQFWPFLRFSASLVLPLHPVPVLLSSAAHLSLPLSSLGKSVEITFHYLAPQGSSSVPTLDCFCPGTRNGFSKFFHFPFAIFPVRYLARSVYKCRRRVACCASYCLGAVAEVTLAEGHSPRLALKFSPGVWRFLFPFQNVFTCHTI